VAGWRNSKFKIHPPLRTQSEINQLTQFKIQNCLGISCKIQPTIQNSSTLADTIQNPKFKIALASVAPFNPPFKILSIAIGIKFKIQNSKFTINHSKIPPKPTINHYFADIL
jgi:hypothetical protein